MSYNMDYLNIDYLKNKFKSNKLISAILYIYISHDDNEKNIISSINTHCIDKNLDIDIINKIKMTALHLYNSKLILYNLPHMLNLDISKNLPSFHIVFGECMAQLLPIMLISESLDIMLNIGCSDENLKDLVGFFVNNVLNDKINLPYNIKKVDLNNDIDQLVIQITELSKLLVDKL